MKKNRGGKREGSGRKKFTIHNASIKTLSVYVFKTTSVKFTIHNASIKTSLFSPSSISSLLFTIHNASIKTFRLYFLAIGY